MSKRCPAVSEVLEKALDMKINSEAILATNTDEEIERMIKMKEETNAFNVFEIRQQMWKLQKEIHAGLTVILPQINGWCLRDVHAPTLCAGTNVDEKAFQSAISDIVFMAATQASDLLDVPKTTIGMKIRAEVIVLLFYHIGIRLE